MFKNISQLLRDISWLLRDISWLLRDIANLAEELYNLLALQVVHSLLASCREKQLHE